MADEKKWKKADKMPISSDVEKLTIYLKSKISSSSARLKNNFSFEDFDQLNKSTMLHLLTFNRKRMGEVNLFKVDDFKRKQKIDVDSDAFRHLSENEKCVAKRVFHVSIKGKWHRPVPILLTEDHSEAIDTIILYIGVAGVGASNPYLFGKGELNTYDGSECLREAALECEAKHPENLTGTQLRKHCSTVLQSLDLSENDLRLLSGFLGHTTKTHLEPYRHPSAVLHTSRLSKVLVELGN